ncbi:MAG: 4Fe-4S dicluster domain-containing protein [Clostridia bacterium]|nr:4Fe-4S dicluster domain-containing protein [Clostridia bacterium]
MKIDMNKRDSVIRMTGINPRTCMKCGKCSATCPSFDEMEYHPHQFISLVEAGRVDELMASESLYNCLACMACLERCPRGVEPAKFVEAVRNLKLREHGGNHLAPEAIPEMLDADLPQQAIVSAFRKYSK